MRPLLVIGAGGLLLWYLNSKGYLSGLFGTTATTVLPPATGTGTTTTGTTTTGTTTPPAPGFNSLAAIYQRLQADAQAPPAGLTAYGWNYSLARVSSITPPDPAPLFAAAGLEPTMNMTAAQYWSVMAPALTTSFGLTGLGFASRYFDRTHGGWAV